MSNTQAFFEKFLPKKFAEKPSIVTDVNSVFQFDLGDAGAWTVDLTQPGGVITAGTAAKSDCTVKVSGADFEKILANPASAMQMVMFGKLKVSNVALGTKLMKLFA